MATLPRVTREKEMVPKTASLCRVINTTVRKPLQLFLAIMPPHPTSMYLVFLFLLLKQYPCKYLIRIKYRFNVKETDIHIFQVTWLLRLVCFSEQSERTRIKISERYKLEKRECRIYERN